MKLKKLSTLLFTTALSALLLAGCGSPTTNSLNLPTDNITSDSEKTFTWALQSDIVSLDPAFAYDLVTGPVVNQISESLLEFDDNGQLIPMLAESWECTDPLTYVYNIRSDVNFSDNTPMTIEDVLYSLNRYRDPEVASYVAWMYGNVESIEQTGEWQITVKLSTPDALWKYVPATSGGQIISKAYYEAHKEDVGKPTGGTMGTGPYKYESWNTGSQVVLTKNENYWNKDVTLSIDKAIYKIINEDTTRISAMTMGQADFTIDPPIDMLNQLESSADITLNSIDTYAIDFLAFNTEVEPFNDVNVRRAIACAIDKETIVNSIYNGVATKANSLPMSHALWTLESDNWKSYSDSSSDYTYNIEQAKSYLAKSSYPNGFECRFLTNELSTRNSMALLIQEALKELNINITIEKVSNDELINMQFGSKLTSDGKKDYDMGIFTWTSDFPDPSGNLYPLFLSTNAVSGGSNTTGFNDATFDKLILKQAASIDSTERTDLMLKACDILYDQVPQVNIQYPKTICVFGKAVEPCEISPAYIWNLYLKNIKLK